MNHDIWPCSSTKIGIGSCILISWTYCLACHIFWLRLSESSWQCLNYSESRNWENCKSRFIFIGRPSGLPKALTFNWEIFWCSSLGKEHPLHSYARVGGPLLFKEFNVTEFQARRMLPQKALGKDPSLSLSASGGGRHSLVCGHRSVSFTWPFLYLCSACLAQISLCLSLIRTLVIVVRVHPSNSGWPHLTFGT